MGIIKAGIGIFSCAIVCVTIFSSAATVHAEVLNSCVTYCHGMPPRDTASRKASPHFNSRSSAFPGNHQTHVKAAPAAGDCTICHKAVGPADFGHQNTIIEMANSLKGYSTAARRAKYNKGVFFNQTSIPNLTNATCSSVNCHFESTTPAWGSVAYASPADCGACHGNPPADGNHPATTGPGKKHGDYYGTSTTSCNKCHNDHTAEAKPFSHATSAGSRSLVLQFTTVPNSGGNYAKTANLAYPSYLPSQTTAASRNGTCTSLYCHSDGNGGAATGVATWGSTLAADCSGCHGGAAGSAVVIATGKHGAHVNNAAVLGTNFGCTECHIKTVSNNTTIAAIANHVNGLKEYSGARAGGSARYNTTAKTCTNIYCHSSGKGSYVNPAAWNSTVTMGCNGCHGTTTATGTPDYTNGGAGVPLANSHAKHALSSADCDKCHTSTSSSGSAINTGAVLHINGAIDVTFNAAKSGSGATWTQSSGTCSNVTCHGGTGSTAIWGATLNCQDCHGNGASSSIADFGATFWNNGTMSKFQMTGTGSWAGNGHGLATGTYTGSGNPAANFGAVANQCEFCHDSTIGHYQASNTFRLRNYSTAAYGRNAPCLGCHSATGTGVTLGATTKKRTTSKVIEADHYGTKHTSALNGGQFCWDCHDPHGTGNSNQYMVRTNPAQVSDRNTGAPTTQAATAAVFTLSATPTGSDYAKSAAPFNGICNVCHTTTSHYTQTSGDSHNAATRCTTCHSHAGSAHGSDAFVPAGGGCNGCHDYDTVGATYAAGTWSGGTWGKNSQDGLTPNQGWGAHAKHINYIKGRLGIAAALDPAAPSFGAGDPARVCGSCHTNNAANHTMTGSTVRTINFGDSTFKIGGAAGTSFLYGATNSVYNGTSGISSATAPKTCSNISCHYFTTPLWSTY